MQDAKSEAAPSGLERTASGGAAARRKSEAASSGLERTASGRDGRKTHRVLQPAGDQRPVSTNRVVVLWAGIPLSGLGAEFLQDLREAIKR